MVLTRGSALLATLVTKTAMAADEGVPLPHGWIGTTSDWARSLGIAPVVMNLAVLAVGLLQPMSDQQIDGRYMSVSINTWYRPRVGRPGGRALAAHRARRHVTGR